MRIHKSYYAESDDNGLESGLDNEQAEESEYYEE